MQPSSVTDRAEGAACELPSTPLPTAEHATSQLGRAFAHALARHDYEALRALLHPEVDFHALTPGRTWEAAGAAQAVEVLATWFPATLDIDESISVELDAVGNRERVGYRFHGRRADGDFVVEQQSYFTARDGQIDWMRIMCTGFQTA